MKPTLRAAIAIAALLPCLGGTAGAATLLLDGTPGAAVKLDGVVIGRLPIDRPLTLAAGEHVLEAVRRGMMPFKTTVRIEAEDTVAREYVRMTPLRRRDAVGYSMVLAGLGQRYEGRRTLGWLLSAVEVGGLGTALVAEISRSNHNDDYILAMDGYRRAVLPDDVARYRTEAEDARTKAVDAADLRDTALIAAGGAVALSILDAWLRFPSLDAGAGPAPVGPAVSAAGASDGSREGFHVAWKVRW